MKRANKYIENKKEKYNANKKSFARIFLPSVLKRVLAIALSFFFLLILTTFVFAEGWDPSKPSHGTLYADTITSKTVGSPVNVADSLFVVDGITTLGNVGIGTTNPGAKLQVNSGAVKIWSNNNPNLYLAGSYENGWQTRFRVTDEGWGIPMYIETQLDGTTWAPAVKLGGGYTGGTIKPSWDVIRLSSTNQPNVFSVSSSAGANDLLTVTQSGNVGIGTASPGQKFTIAGTAPVAEIRDGGYLMIRPMNNANDFRLTALDAGGGDVVWGGAITTSIMRWANNGNVGIGTTNPLDKLSVAGSIGVGGAGFDNPGGVSGQGIAFPSTYNDAHRIYGEHDGGDTSNLIIEQRDNTNDAVIFREVDCCGAGTLDYMRIARDGMHYIGGNVGIGTTNPGAKLDVTGGGIQLSSPGNTIRFMQQTAPAQYYEMVSGAAYGAGNDDFTLINQGGTQYFSVDPSATKMTLMRSGGSVGIGTTNPGSRLEVENTASADDVLLLEDSSGLCEAQPTTTGLTWSCSSDKSLKENISISTFSSLNYLMNIPLFDYNVKKTGERAMGVIAQELNITHPELVSVGDDGLLIASTPTTWQLVKAIQELETENEQLKARLAALETKVK